MNLKRLSNILIACTIAQALTNIRPGASWSLKDNAYAGLDWTDQTQAKPTPSEIVTEIQSCTAAATSRATTKVQARLDVKNTSLTQAQRMQALLILLDFDN